MGDIGIGVIGATGAVGRTMLTVLHERGVPAERIRAIASARSAGKNIPFGDQDLTVRPLDDDAFSGVDVALFALDDPQAREWVPRARDHGVTVVDNSAAYRMDPDVPLVVPEVNGHLLEAGPGLVANPNCSTIVSVMALAPLHRAVGLRRVVGVTFQAASGAGAAAETALREGARAYLHGEAVHDDFFPRPLAFDCLPQVGAIDDAGHAREERKMLRETRRILDAPELDASFTCVRVPTFVSHAVALHVDTARAVDAKEAAALFADMPGLLPGDGSDPSGWPSPRTAEGIDPVFVGRIRETHPSGLAFWVVGDNLRKGAATNAIQIADALPRAR